MAFEIFQSEKSGKYYFRLKATNGQVILASEAYENKDGATNGVRSVVQNTAGGDDKFDRREAKDGSSYFVLKAGNGQIIGKSEMYASKQGMENGIKSVISNANGAGVTDLT
jgi:uncharacterized protein YegP (UPF0339 family)